MIEPPPSRTGRASRRLTRLALAVPIAVTGMIGVAATAQADAPSRVLPARAFCPFAVTETILTNNINPISNPSGDRFTGHFVVQFAANGKSQTFNASGAEQTSVSGNTETDVYTGPSVFVIGPQGRANTKAPAISFAPGRTVVVADITDPDNATVTSFSPTVPVTDVCALLAP